jgi:enoyl-CoA hydratase/carnithine racemase
VSWLPVSFLWLSPLFSAASIIKEVGIVEYQNIIVEKQNHVVTLTFNRPEKMNTISLDMRDEIFSALNEINEDDDARVMILTGAGDRAFCAGVDVSVMSARIAGQVDDNSRKKITLRAGFHIQRVREIRVPTIAAVNGAAAGMGLSFVAACDIRIGADNSKYSCAWINRGLVPDGGATHLLPQIVGIEKALELFYTGAVIDAQEALRIGLVSRLAPQAELMKAARDLADRIAAGPPIAQEMAKYGVYKGLLWDFRTALDFENYAIKVCAGTEDFKEGVKAFVEKRKADFKGR